MNKHDDDRRTLLEMSPGDFKVCKAVVVKQRSILGLHKHEHKDERFMLVQGLAHAVQIGEETWLGIQAPYEWIVPRGVWHAFELEAGSILVGTATELYNPDDEIAA